MSDYKGMGTMGTGSPFPNKTPQPLGLLERLRATSCPVHAQAGTDMFCYDGKWFCEARIRSLTSRTQDPATTAPACPECRGPILCSRTIRCREATAAPTEKLP